MSITTDYPISYSEVETSRVAGRGVAGRGVAGRGVVGRGVSRRAFHGGVGTVRAPHSGRTRSRATVERRRYVGVATPQGRVDPYADACADSRESDQKISWTATVVGVLATAVVILGMVGLANLRAGSIEAAASDGAASSEVSAYSEVSASSDVAVVQPNETLGDLAQRIAPGEPVQRVVDRLLELNALDSAIVTPGQELITPSAADE